MVGCGCFQVRPYARSFSVPVFSVENMVFVWYTVTNILGLQFAGQRVHPLRGTGPTDRETCMEKHRRVMLKLSGEALAGDKHSGFDEETVRNVAKEVRSAYEEGVEIAVVIGGGNFWRGRSSKAFDRVKADQIGMLATVMNCIYVSEIFRGEGMKTKLFGAFEIPGILPVFEKDAVMEALSGGNVVFFAGGTGHPYFSTDSGIALRAIEIEADSILLAKAVDGVYDSDPAKNPAARKFDRLSISEVVERKLQVIDLTASILCMENHMPLAVFSLNEPGSITDALNGRINGTVITAD